MTTCICIRYLIDDLLCYISANYLWP